MKKLANYAKTSSIMDLKIEFDGKVYAFNLDEELRISEDSLNTEVKTHVRSYAFLAMLHKKLSIKLQDEQQHFKRVSDKKFEQLSKTQEKVTFAKAMLSNDKTLVLMQKKLDQMNELKEYLGIAVSAYAIRKDLLQTLAANTRIETKHT